MIQENVDAHSSLQENMDQYGRPSILAAQVEELKAYFTKVKKRNKKVSADVAEACLAFEMDQKSLQQRKEDRTIYLRSLKEKTIAAQRKSRQSLKRAMDDLGMAREEMLEQAQMFYIGLTTIVGQLNPLANLSNKESGVDD